MGTLYLIRHGQASFGADDYDQLSALGHRQSQQLGRFLGHRFAQEQVHPARVLMGSLRRHRETWQGVAEGAQWTHPAEVFPELNEYDSLALIEALHPGPLAKPDTPELYRQHFRWLREALQAWMDGRIAPHGMPSYEAFVQGIEAVLRDVRKNPDGHVLLVSSGGPISTIVSRVLQAPPSTSIELNLRIRNTALSELHVSASRHTLLTYNTLPHLQDLPASDWVTYA